MREATSKDFTSPRRMGWEALILLYAESFIKIAKQYWFLLLPIIFGGKGTGKVFLAIALVVIFFLIIGPLISYLTTRIQIKDEKIITSTGWLNKRTKTIPLNRVHALRTKSGPIYQALDMVGIVFDTIADKGQELEFILNEEDWQMMLNLVTPEESASVEQQHQVQSVKEQSTYKMSPRQIIKGALAQNHLRGLWFIILALWYLFTQLSDYKWILDRAVAYTEAQFVGATTLFYIALFIAAYLLGLLIWCAYMLFRYWGLQITFHNNRLEYEAGLFTRKTIRIRRDKVVGLGIKQNFLEKRWGLMTFKFQQATFALGEKEKGLLTVLGMDAPEMILDWWFTNKEQHLSEPILVGHSQFGLFWRNLYQKSIFLLLPLVLFIVFEAPLPLYFIFPPLFLYFLFESWMIFKKSKMEIFDDRIVVHGGFLAQQSIIMPMDRVERLERRQLFLFGKSFQSGHLTIKSMGSDLMVRSLRLPTLSQAYDYLLFRASVK